MRPLTPPTTPVTARLGWTGPTGWEPLWSCQSAGTHAHGLMHTCPCTICCLLYPTPFVVHSRGRGDDQCKDKQSGETQSGQEQKKSQQEASVECPLPYASSQNGVSHARPLIRPDKPGLYGPSRFTPALLAACTPSPAGTMG